MIEPTIKIPKQTVEYAMAVLIDRNENMSHYAHFSLSAQAEIKHHIEILKSAHSKIKQEKGVKMWMCPECGDIVTEKEIIDDINEGGFGMCLCQFGNGQRVLIKYVRYVEV